MKLTQVTTLAILASVVTLSALPAMAQVAPSRTPTCTAYCGGGGSDRDDEPGNPGFPEFPGGKAHLLASCKGKLGHLRDVTVSQVQDFEAPKKVRLEKICDMPLTGGEKQAISDSGNVGGLRTAIGANDTIVAKLRKEQFKADDVLGIAFDQRGNVTLYVNGRG